MGDGSDGGWRRGGVMRRQGHRLDHRQWADRDGRDRTCDNFPIGSRGDPIRIVHATLSPSPPSAQPPPRPAVPPSDGRHDAALSSVRPRFTLLLPHSGVQGSVFPSYSA
jgi:hypothetical protein